MTQFKGFAIKQFRGFPDKPFGTNRGFPQPAYWFSCFPKYYHLDGDGNVMSVRNRGYKSNDLITESETHPTFNDEGIYLWSAGAMMLDISSLPDIFTIFYYNGQMTYAAVSSHPTVVFDLMSLNQSRYGDTDRVRAYYNGIYSINFYGDSLGDYRSIHHIVVDKINGRLTSYNKFGSETINVPSQYLTSTHLIVQGDYGFRIYFRSLIIFEGAIYKRIGENVKKYIINEFNQL